MKAIYNMKWASNWKTNTNFTFTTFWAYGVKVVLFFRLEAVFTLKSALKVECHTQKRQVLQFPKKIVIFNKIIHFYPILDFVQIFWHMSNILDKTCVQCTEGPALCSFLLRKKEGKYCSVKSCTWHDVFVQISM